VRSGAQGGSPSTTVAYFDRNGSLNLLSPLLVNQGALSSNAPFMSHTAVWNDGGSGTGVFTNWVSNVINTSSSASSKLFDYQVGGADKVWADVGGNFFAQSLGVGGTSLYKLTLTGASKNTVYYGLNTSSLAAGDTLNYAVASNSVAGAVRGFNYSVNSTGNFTSAFANTNNSSPSADTSFSLVTTGASGGSPYIGFSISGVQAWWTGADNRHSQEYRIGYGGSTLPGATPVVRIDTSGNTTFAGAVTIGGVPKFAGANVTGTGTPSWGANCPAVNCSTPYTWIKVKTSDGSDAYLPVFK
jgi:hypothetical protein